MSVASETELRDAIKVARIKLEQSLQRLGGEAQPVPWAEVAAQATATERVFADFLAEIEARIGVPPHPTSPGREEFLERAARYRALIQSSLVRARLEVELEATEAMLAEVRRMELTAPPPPPRGPRLMS